MKAEIYVSPAGIRVCNGGFDQAFTWLDAAGTELQDCWGHGQFEILKAGLKLPQLETLKVQKARRKGSRNS